jgi:DNA-binding transcriptional MerR regulator
MSFDDIVADLKVKQIVIEGLHRSLMEQKSMAEHKIEEFAKPLQEQIDKLDKELQEKMAEYKMECKKHFGIADGDKMNVVETLVAFKKVMTL